MPQDRRNCDPLQNASSGRLTGYVDSGQSLSPGDRKDVELATTVLVSMAAGVSARWKLPTGYFLNSSCSGEL